MEEATYAMIHSGANAENVGNLIIRVWNNAIYEKNDPTTDKYVINNGKFVSDFNIALDNLFADKDFIQTLSDIKNDQVYIADLMKKLTDPPKEYKEAYSALMEYYENYNRFTKAIIDPTGSLKTFSEEFNANDKMTVDSYEKVKLYLDLYH